MNYFGQYGEEKEALEILLPVVEQAIKAHQQGDYDAYITLVDDSLAKEIDREQFIQAHQEIHPQLGNIVSKRFLGGLNRGGDPMLLFSAKYELISDDILINITFENGSRPPRIRWLWIE